MTTPDNAARALRALQDRQELVELLDRYFLDVDHGGFDDAWAASVFTPDVEVIFPVATYAGIDGMADVHQEALGRFERTQHIPSSRVVSLGEDEAVVGSNVLMIHVHLPERREALGEDSHFLVGGWFEAQAARTKEGWRIRRLACTVIWTSGRPPAGVPA
jgi:hypothetical protein